MLQRQESKHTLDSIKRGVTIQPYLYILSARPDLHSLGGVPRNISTEICFSFLFSPLDPRRLIASVGSSKPASLVVFSSFPFPTNAVGLVRAPPPQPENTQNKRLLILWPRPRMEC